MNPYRIAESFFLYNILFTVLFFLVSLGVSYFAYKTYRLTKLRKPKLFTYAFILLSFSHLFVVVSMLEQFLTHFGPPGDDVMEIAMACYMFAFILFFITTLKTKELAVPLSLAAIIGFILILLEHAAFVFHGITAILLLFVVWYYWKQFWKKKHLNNLITFVAFFLMLLGNLLLVFTLLHPLFFTIAQSLQLLGYLAFLGNLVWVLKK